MKKILFALLLIGFQFAYSQNATTFILVRHAEKAQEGTKNPPLTEAGMDRAEKLSEMLSNQKVTALYATPYKRTQETLLPLSKSKNLSVGDYDPLPKTEWWNEVLEKHEGGTIVISGHSNTIPVLANTLLGTETLNQFDDSDYSNLIIITANELGKGTLIRLKF